MIGRFTGLTDTDVKQFMRIHLPQESAYRQPLVNTVKNIRDIYYLSNYQLLKDSAPWKLSLSAVVRVAVLVH
jgi:hypothetical protein